jgi:NAD(P)-dependent dehydrogenase (short-subunit alcohol dehydrogenase family)
MTDACAEKRVLVTGGTSGIGAAIAREFARAGATVTVTGLTQDEVDTFTADNNQSITGCVLDVSDEACVASLVGSFDRLEVLVNCEGTILRDGQEFEPDLFARVVDVNLTGTMRLCVACRPLLADSRGCIVNTASMLTFFGSGFSPGYSASKGA